MLRGYCPAVNRKLHRLYEARRAALEAEAAVLDADDDALLVPVLGEGIEEARALSDRTERSFRLQVLADLCPKVQDPGALALLLGILGEDDPSVRARAAMALATAGRTRYPEVVQAAQDALDRGLGGPALLELPGLLLDASGGEHPPPVDLLVALVDHEDPEVVAEAACALAEIDVPGVRDLLESLVLDERVLADAEGETTLGAFVEDLLDALTLGAAMGSRAHAGDA